jgi:UDP-N-acetylmuramoyl-tripeptide--D-alanyl-D-alanine ligase
MRQTGNWLLKDILEATRGEWRGKKVETFTGITDDTRVLQPGDLFIALKGERHDGHHFIPQAIERGAKGIIIARDFLPQWPSVAGDYATIVVSDTLIALGDIARFWRKRFLHLPLIAITGSSGKTTTKEVIAWMLSSHFKVLKSEGNYNNQIGLPFTLLGIRPEHEVICVELGTNAEGEIDYLASLALPQIGVITNIQPAHLEGLKSLKVIQREKGSLLTHIRECFVYNADDPQVASLALDFAKEKIGFGLKNGLIRAKDIEWREGGLGFSVHTPDFTFRVQTQLVGKHQIYAFLAAVALGWYLRLTKNKIAQALAAFKPLSGRLTWFRDKKGRIILDDTYNANPGSMQAALEALSAFENDKIAVLGDMLELGAQDIFWHEEIGKKAGSIPLKALLLYGQYAESFKKGALKAGMDEKRIFILQEKTDILPLLKKITTPGDVILFKASNKMGFSELVKRLREQP